MTLLSLLVTVSLNLLLGWQCLRLLGWQRHEPVGLPVRVVLSYLLGQLISSLTYFIWLLCMLDVFLGWLGLDMLIAIIMLTLGRSGTWRQQLNQPWPGDKPQDRMWLRTLIWFVLLLALPVIAVTVSWLAMRVPYGAWDAAAEWNLRAMFLVQPDQHWQYVLSEHVANSDYPLLHCIALARLFAFSGDWSSVVSQWFAFAHAVMAMILLVGTLMRLTRAWVALLAGMLLIGTKFWWGMTCWQYADHTICAYMLASAVMLGFWLHTHTQSLRQSAGLLIVLALLTGACAWTKNEGLTWVIGMSLIVFASLLIRHQPRQWALCAAWILGLVVIMWMPMTVKLMSHQQSVVMAGMSEISLSDRLFDVHRTVAIFKQLGQIFYFNHPDMALLLAVVLLLSLAKRINGSILWIKSAVLLLWILQVGSILLVYQLTTQPLAYYIGTSADRLMLQLWPVLLLAGGLWMAPVSQPANPLPKSDN